MRRLVWLVVIAAVLLPTPVLRADAAGNGSEEVPELVSMAPPQVHGTPRYGRTLRATPGRWSERPTRVRYQWLRDGEWVEDATGMRYPIRPEDVGHRIRVEVTAIAPGHQPGIARSVPTRRVGYDVPVRRRVGYRIQTRGHVSVDLARFAELAQETYDDPRGWHGRGVAFHRVRHGGAFTLVLAQARTLPSFSSECSRVYSCRVGRFVVINQTRWRRATPVWRRAGGTVRDYRHLVVNHETGHWLGFGHAGCPRRGALAPVMMQQSKGLDGCRINPWPTTHELGR